MYVFPTFFPCQGTPVVKTIADIQDQHAEGSIEHDLSLLMDQFFAEQDQHDGLDHHQSTQKDTVPPKHSEESSSCGLSAGNTIDASDISLGTTGSIAEDALSAGVKEEIISDNSLQVGKSIPSTSGKDADTMKQSDFIPANNSESMRVHSTFGAMHSDYIPHNIDTAGKQHSFHDSPVNSKLRHSSTLSDMGEDDDELAHSVQSNLSPNRFQGLSQGAESTDDAVLDNLGDEYLARRQIRMHTLEQRFKYPKRMIESMMTAAGLNKTTIESTQWLRKLRQRLGSWTFSTSFSGIDTPNIATLMLCFGLDELDPDEPPTKPPQNKWACEISNACRSEMTDSINPPKCIFGNVQDFWEDALRSKVESIREQNLVERVLLPLVRSGEATKSSAYCYKCQKVHDAEEADEHLAGTSCTAFSKKGLHNMLDDVTFLDLIAWVAQRRKLQEKFLCQENVEDFPTTKLVDWLGDLYDIQVILMDPGELGWGIRRRRKYHFMRHKFKAGPMSCPLNLFASLFVTEEEEKLVKKLCHNVPEWDMYFVAGPDELIEELEWASGRDSVSVKQPTLNWKDMVPNGAYEMSLNKFERTQLDDYRTAFPLQCYQLNQSFDAQATRSSDSFLPTIIKNAGVIWNLGIGIIHLFILFSLSLCCCT